MPVQPALKFLSGKGEAPAPVVVVFGDEGFLRLQVIQRLRDVVLAGEDSEFSFTRFAADTAWRDVNDELSTVALFGGGNRLVVVDDADDFVSSHRAELERYVEHPNRSSVLVLVLSSFAKNTRLYKAVEQSGLAVDCSVPSEGDIRRWLVEQAKARYQATLESAAADMLLEMVGPEMGLLDQELAKLASFAGQGKEITSAMVQELVGTWRTKTTWQLIDATLDGNAAEALAQLDRVLRAGESPLMLLAAFGYRLRQFAAATRLIEQAEASRKRLSLRDALVQAGAKPFSLRTAEPQLRQVGRHRAGQLFRTLLEVDMALKGESRLDPRVVIERMIVQLASPELK